MAINKVVYGNQTLIDLTTDTVASSDDILAGKVGHLRDGTVVTGTASGGDQHGTIWQDAQGYVHLDDESGIALQSKTATPTESQQVIEADTGYYALDKVTVGAISSSYVGSGITRRSSSDLTVSGATVTAPAGYYSAQASKSVATGTAGTPTATKGTVSNHAVTVTPSVTNTTGYISGGTKTGTGVTVSAYELVSGTKSITENGTGIDVTNYASVNVSVPSDDFIITFTQNQSGNWEPNCTYTEAYNAYSAGKTIAGRTNATEGVGFEFDNDNIYYTISEFYDSSDGTGVKQTQYVWHFGGITNQGETITYDTIFANAIPSDVASGKVFYNAQGIQTGTASGGGTSNIVTGTITAGTAGSIQTVTVPYNGNGYIVSLTLYVNGGNLSTSQSNWYSIVHTYALSQLSINKSRMETSPNYTQNNVYMNSADVAYQMKGSTSDGTLLSGGRAAEVRIYRSDIDPTNGATTALYINSNNSFKVRICGTGNGTYGLLSGVSYTYIAVFSE